MVARASALAVVGQAVLKVHSPVVGGLAWTEHVLAPVVPTPELVPSVVHHIVLSLYHVLHLLLNITKLSTIYRRPVVLLVLVPVIIITLTINW